jgi:hypothetical protein
MDISIGSYKVSIEMLLLIVLMLWIILGHAMCSCSTVGLMEGLKMMSGAESTKPQLSSSQKKGTMKDPKEGFTNNSNSTFSETQFAATNTPDYYMNPNDWAQQSLVYTAGTKPSPAVQSIWDRSKNQAPRKPGQISFFDNVNFKPECCNGSEYSSSMGCACLTVEDYKLLNQRGGNNVPYSEY